MTHKQKFPHLNLNDSSLLLGMVLIKPPYFLLQDTFSYSPNVCLTIHSLIILDLSNVFMQTKTQKCIITKTIKKFLVIQIKIVLILRDNLFLCLAHSIFIKYLYNYAAIFSHQIQQKTIANRVCLFAYKVYCCVVSLFLYCYCSCCYYTSPLWL